MDTKHKPDCARVFKRYDLSCPRCQELAEGFPARQGWGQKARQDAQQSSRDLYHHLASERHRSGACGPVCTFGDW